MDIPENIKKSPSIIKDAESSSKPRDPCSDSAEVYKALRALGAPEIPSDEFSRLYKGSLADILKCVAEHVLGRQNTADARTIIHKFHQSAPKPRNLSLVDNAYKTVQNARSRLARAQRELDSLQKLLSERQDAMRKSEQEVEQLQMILENKRQTSMLLSVLERKERIRNERLAELGRLAKMGSVPLIAARKSNTQKINVSLLERAPVTYHAHHRVDRTADVIAALQAHQIVLAQTTIQQPGIHDADENGLREVLNRRMGLPHDDEQVTIAFTRCLQAARVRVWHKLHYSSILPLEENDPNPDMILARVMEKEFNLQGLSDSLIALGFSCGKLLHKQAEFHRKISPALKVSLRKEGAAVQGYVDRLRLSVIHDGEGRLHNTENIVQVTQLTGGKTWDRFLADVETDVRFGKSVKIAFAIAGTVVVYEQDVFLHSTQLPALSTSSLVSDAIGAYEAAEREVHGRQTALLARRLEKGRMGNVLVRDIETLMNEVKLVAGWS